MKERILKEYKINKHIELKLVDDGNFKETRIFINNERFLQCKYILLNITKDDLKSTEDIHSIDQAAEVLDHSLEDLSLNHFIPAETIFFAHCSNLQAWAEYDYNTRLLHRNLAFPLLRKLTEVGDKKAEMFFREEIIDRYSTGSDNVKKYLLEERYLDFLSTNDLITILEGSEYDKIAQMIVKHKGSEYGETLRSIVQGLSSPPLYFDADPVYSWDSNYDQFEDIEGDIPDSWTVFDELDEHIEGKNSNK